MNTKILTRTAIMLAITLVIQIGFSQFAQPIVGPLVNMMLILTVITVSGYSGIAIGTVTPILAFMVGIMVLVPLIPVIVIGNILYVVSYLFIRKVLKIKFYDYIAVIPAALIKFGFLFLSVNQIVPLFVGPLKPPVIAAFSLPQLYTALIGGFLAVFISQFLKGTERVDSQRR